MRKVHYLETEIKAIYEYLTPENMNHSRNYLNIYNIMSTILNNMTPEEFDLLSSSIAGQTTPNLIIDLIETLYKKDAEKIDYGFIRVPLMNS